MSKVPTSIESQPWNVGEAIGAGWLAFKQQPIKVLLAHFLLKVVRTGVLLALIFVVVQAAQELQRAPFAGLVTSKSSSQLLLQQLLSTRLVVALAAVAVLTLLMEPVIKGALIAFSLPAVRGEQPRTRDVFKAFHPLRALSLMVVGILRLITALPPFLGVFLASAFSLAEFYVVDAEMGPIDAMRASFRATRGQRFFIYLYLLGIFPAALIGLMAGGIGILFTMPIYHAGFAYICTRQAARTERPLFSPEWGSKYLRRFLRLAFLVNAVAFGIACFVLLRDKPQPRGIGWSPIDMGVRAFAVILGISLVGWLVASVLPAILDVLESRSFPAFVGARHVRSQKSGFLTIISVLAILGVAMSSCSLSSVASIMGGFSADLKRKILGNNAHIVIDTEDRKPFANWNEVVEKARTAPGVVGATPVAQGEVMVQSASNLAGVIVRGVDADSIGNVIDVKNNIEVGKFDYLSDPDKLRRLPPDEVVGIGKQGERFLKGKDILPLTDDLDPAVREAVNVRPLYPSVIIGRELARTLHVYVGDDVTLVSPVGEVNALGIMPKMKKFRVAAVFYSGMYEYDASHVYVMLDVAQEYFGLENKVNFVDIRTADIKTSDKAVPGIAAAIERPDLRVRDWRELNRGLFAALGVERFAMFAVLTIAIAVASFCIICTLLLMVTEKAKEIAILKAMGASDGAIQTTFMGEGMIIGAIGTTFGVSMALALCLGLKWFGLPLNPEVYYIDKLPVNVEPADFAVVAVAALIICLLATLLPAYRASRIKPVDGLRYE